MNRIYKVIWNEALNCFTAVGEYAKARGKSSKSSVSANATINTTDNLSSTSAFKLTAIGLGLMAAGLTMSPQVFAAKGVGNSISIGTANNCANNSTTNTTNASSGLANSVAVGCNSVADLSTDPSITFYNRENPSNLPPVNFSTDTPFNSTAVGTNAKAYQAGTSIGMNASSRSLGIALGVQAKSDNVAAVAIGPAALATGNTSLALGRQSAATENFAQAIGNVASATGVGSLAMGHSAKAEGYRSIAIGSTDIVSARPTDDQPGVIYNPIGQTKAIGVDSIAFGSGAQALGDRSVAIGEGNTVNGANSIAVGTGHIVSGNNSGAFGDPNTVNGMNSYAIGNNNTIAGNNAFVLGNNVTIANGLNGAVGIGNNASVTAINSVALGQGSVATVQSGASFLTNIAANANNGTVAVGAVASERRIINVAAGSSDTDAVNVSQLRALDTIVSDIDFPIRSSSAQPYTTSVTGTDALAVGSNAIANGDRSTAVGENAKAIGIQASAFGAGAEATARSSLASGFKAKAKSGESVALGVRSSAEGLGATAVGPTANARGEDSVALGRRSKADGAGAMALGGFSEAVGENASAVGFNAEASMGGTAIGQSSSAASNATALGRSAIAGQSGNVALGNSSVTTAQHIGSFSINNLPVAGLTSGARTVSVGTVGAERQIQNVAPGVVDANSTDAINGSQLNATNSRVTTNTTNISNNTNAIAEGIKFNVNNSLQRTFALGEEIKFDTDSNLTTTALPSGDGIKLALADIVNVGSGATPVKIDGTARTISGLSNVTFNPATTYTGGQAATQEQLTAASGALTELGFNITADNKDLGPGEVEDNVKLGETVNFTNADGNLVATVSDNGINYDLAPDITLTSVTISDGINDTTLTTDARGLSVNQSKIVDILDGNVTSTSQQAINGRQLFSTAQSIANNLGGGSVVNTDGTVSTPVYQVNGNDQTGVAGAIEELDKGFNLKTNGANISTVKAGDTIDIGTATGETNIEVAKTGNDIKFKLANNIDLNSVTTGNTVMDTGGITVTNPNRPDRTASLTSRGLTISNGPSVLRSGIDAGNKKITGVAAGDVNQDSTDAV
ncbi:ESPR-type extended signal peptide-containing protein, partial [uncultured Psychrobacter sp.]